MSDSAPDPDLNVLKSGLPRLLCQNDAHFLKSYFSGLNMCCALLNAAQF